MAHWREYAIDVTTDGSGNASGYLPASAITGELISILIKPSGNPWTDGAATLTITKERYGQPVLTYASVPTSSGVVPRAPIQPAHEVATGGAIASMRRPIGLDNDRLSYTVSGGGASKTCRLVLCVA